jgi:hypothetical protein
MKNAKTAFHLGLATYFLEIFGLAMIGVAHMK